MTNRHEDSSAMASGPLKIKKGTCPVLILATHRHTIESVETMEMIQIDGLPASYETGSP